MALHILDSRSGTCLAALDGEMNIYAAAGLKEALGQLASGHPALEVDLSGITEMDTAGLQVLLMAERRPGCAVRFTNHSPAVRQLLQITHLEPCRALEEET